MQQMSQFCKINQLNMETRKYIIRKLSAGIDLKHTNEHLLFLLKITINQEETTGHLELYRVAQNKRPEMCITIMARILHGAKFPLAHL